MPVGKDGKHPGGRPVTTGVAKKDLRHKVNRDAHDAARAALEADARKRLLGLAKTRLTRELIDEIVSKISTGNYPSVIAESLGVTTGTFLDWMRKGRTTWETQDAPETEFSTARDPEALRVELYLRVSQVEAGWEVDLVSEMAGRIRDGGYWQGHMTMLQRRKPDRWDNRGRLEGGSERTLEEQLAELEKERGATTPQ